MFGSQTRFLVVFGLLACVSVTLAENYIYTGTFVETKTDAPNTSTSGTFYYLYSTEGKDKCRFRVEYTLPGNQKVNNLYQYLYDAGQNMSVLYSMCDDCTAESVQEMPDPWWLDSIYSDTGSTKQVTLGGASHTLKWFSRVNGTAKSSQVYRILMNGVTDPTTTLVGAIEFSDGRVFTLSSFSYLTPSQMTPSNAKFQASNSCPRPTCSMFADIVFVLDFSGSVGCVGWNQTSDFAIAVMNSFTFGDQAAAAACIQFNGPRYVYKGTGLSRAVTCNHNSTVQAYRFYTDYVNPPDSITEDTTASVLAGADSSSGKTVSINRVDLINNMQTPRCPSIYHNTCQSWGLELAMKVFDRSPRKNKNPPPHRIVIAVTDGDDHCPNRTVESARKLRDDYGAFFIGVGVGLECDYDKDFIRNLSTILANQPSYFDVKGYSQIKTLVDKLFTPLCDQYSSRCGLSCKGFCGCGKCFCPDCANSVDKCDSITCTARDGTSNGCVYSRKDCGEKDSNKCIQYSCNEENATCQVTHTCDAKRESYPYQCQTVTCNLEDGSCPVDFDHEFCKLKHKKDCEEWRCVDTPNGKAEDKYGCVMVTNYTQKCDERGSACNRVRCDWETFKCIEEDLCVEKNNECFKFKCINGVCEATSVDRPALFQDDNCTKYSCFNKSGWKKDEANSLDNLKCRAKYMKEHPDDNCKIHECVGDVEGGCTVKDDGECNWRCKQKEDECWEIARNSSSLRECIFTKCKALDAEAPAECDYKRSDCSKSDAAKDAEKNNNNNEGCYSYICSLGVCEMIEVLPRHKSTACETWTCVGDIEHGWQWEHSYTDEYNKCADDVCYTRKCDDEQGCIPVKEICESKSNMCSSFTCKENKTCEETSLLKTYDCMHEECSPEGDGTKIAVWDEDVYGNIDKSCPSLHNCTTVECPRDPLDPTTYGRCVYTNITHGDDKCVIYTCNTSDDTWIESPKCDDGFACTEDKCSVDGDCWTVDIDCYQYVNMTGYPCFRAACKEDSSSETGYRCVRRLKMGAYIDICGRCIRESDAGSSEVEGSSIDKGDIACTDAPEEPIFKEGIAAASIAMIVLAAVIVGGALTTTSVIGTKTLLERARAANNQSAHSNPLFEDNAAEMTNPTFAGDD